MINLASSETICVAETGPYILQGDPRRRLKE